MDDTSNNYIYGAVCFFGLFLQFACSFFCFESMFVLLLCTRDDEIG